MESGKLGFFLICLLFFFSHDEGKEAMSVALLKMLCRWFLINGETNDGLFAHCFLLLTWNLGCQVNNMKIVHLQDITWAYCFDCFHINFNHSKTDQYGDESQDPRHIFANHSDPIMCPFLSRAMYFSSCFSGNSYSKILLCFLV
jgi:hypothetical protein